MHTVYPKKYAHGFCFAVLCCGYTLTDFPISIRLTSLALWQSNDCPSASKATLMNMDKYFMWIHYERLHNHNKAKHNKTVCIFLGIYCNSITYTPSHLFLLMYQHIAQLWWNVWMCCYHVSCLKHGSLPEKDIIIHQTGLEPLGRNLLFAAIATWLSSWQPESQPPMKSCP